MFHYILLTRWRMYRLTATGTVIYPRSAWPWDSWLCCRHPAVARLPCWHAWPSCLPTLKVPPWVSPCRAELCSPLLHRWKRNCCRSACACTHAGKRCTHAHVRTHTNTHTHTHTRTHIHTRTHACARASTHARVRTHTHACALAHARTYTRTHARARTHARTHTQRTK